MSTSGRHMVSYPRCNEVMEARYLGFHINDVHESVLCTRCDKRVRKKNLKKHKC